MTYSKPNVRYVDMAIYIDEHVYKQTTEVEDNLIYEYLYHLAIMLARKGKYFKKADDYDKFGLLAATRMFTRLRSKKQFELDADGKPKLTPIKSSLNFLKSIMYPLKATYQQEYYSQVISKELPEINYDPNFNSSLVRSVDRLNVTDFRLCLNNIADCAEMCISRIPKKLNSDEYHNIYVSCLLTFLNSITISRKNKKRVFKDCDGNVYYKDVVLKKILKEENNDPVILYHLDESMKDYILVLTREIKHSLAQELSQALHTHISSEVNEQDLIMCNVFDVEEYT